MKINKVERLGDNDWVFYDDLKPDDAFVWVKTIPDEKHYLCVKTQRGHIYRDGGCFVSGDATGVKLKVIPVDAEINWCYKNGGEG